MHPVPRTALGRYLWSDQFAPLVLVLDEPWHSPKTVGPTRGPVI